MDLNMQTVNYLTHINYSNVTNLITAILLNVNVVTPGNDLTGAVVTKLEH